MGVRKGVFLRILVKIDILNFLRFLKYLPYKIKNRYFSSPEIDIQRFFANMLDILYFQNELQNEYQIMFQDCEEFLLSTYLFVSNVLILPQINTDNRAFYFQNH